MIVAYVILRAWLRRVLTRRAAARLAPARALTTYRPAANPCPVCVGYGCHHCGWQGWV